MGASFGSTLAVLAHISLSRPWEARWGGGGRVLIKKYVRQAHCTTHKEMSR